MPSPTKAAQAKEQALAPLAQVPGSLFDPGALRFWAAVVLTGVGAGLGAALLTALLKEVQYLAWGAYEPSALTEAARNASPWRHILLLLGAGLLTGAGQWLLTRLPSGNSIDTTTAIWFQAGRLPTLRTLGSAVLSIVIVGMGASLGREGAPKQAGAVFGNLASDWQSLSDEQRRLLAAIGAGAGMAAVYSMPLGGALFALEVLRGTLALRLVLPALAATTIATGIATFVVPNAPIYPTPAYAVTAGTYAFAVLAAPLIGLWSVGFVRLIAWADRSRPSDWRRSSRRRSSLSPSASFRSPFRKSWATGRTSPSACSVSPSRSCPCLSSCRCDRSAPSPRSRAARRAACSPPRSPPARLPAERSARSGSRSFRTGISACSPSSGPAR